ncbi:MAG: SH3 domain-containing protein, partial [Oscillospiraceae bacterium]|nr:SH3 domain-containing protein [Oscillospiraceae bacterium]
MKKGRTFSRMLRAGIAVSALCALLAVSVSASAVSGTVTEGPLRMRTGPDTSYTVITNLPAGTAVEVTGCSGGWYQVSYGGQSGYVSGDYIQLAEALTGTVTASVLNVRTAPDINAGVMAKLVEGNQVSVTGITPGWYQIALQGATGYVSADYLTIQQPPRRGTVNTAVLNVRTAPDVNAGLMGKLNYGTELDLLAETNGWYQITLQGKTGYVSAEYITPAGQAMPAPAAQAAPQQPATKAPPVSTDGSVTGDQIVAIAKSYLGTPYVYGGSSASGFDCSGFTSYVYGQAGIYLIHGASSQMTKTNGTSVSRDQLQPG